MNVSSIVFNRNWTIKRNIDNKTVLDKTGYKKPITQPDCFVSFRGKTEEKETTVKMGKKTISLFNDIRKIYDGLYKETNQKIIENLTKGIALQNLINLKFNKFFNLSMTDNDSENPTEFMKTPENDNKYQLTYKDEKNNTQKIVLTNDTMQIESTSVLSSQDLNKIVFKRLNKLKSALNNEEMCKKTADIIKSRLELKNTLREKATNFMKSYVDDVNTPWNFPFELCNKSRTCWLENSYANDKIVRELESRKHWNGKDMHAICYLTYPVKKFPNAYITHISKIENLDNMGNTVSYYKVEKEGSSNYISEFVRLKEPRYKKIYDSYGNQTTIFNKDGLEFNVKSSGKISTKIKDIGEVVTTDKWIEIKKDDTVEHFEFSEENGKSQKLTEYSVTDKDGVIRKYNLLNFGILESVRDGYCEVFYNKDGSKNKEIEYEQRCDDPKTVKIYGADELLEKELFYNYYSREVDKTVIYNGGIKEKEFGKYYTGQYRTDGTLKSKTFKEYTPPAIFKYSSNENFRKIGNQSSEVTFTENYAEDGETLLSYTYNGETETVKQLNKDKSEFLKQEALAEKAKKATKTKKTTGKKKTSAKNAATKKTKSAT